MQYIKDKENEMMEEEVTRAIALANRNKDLKELAVISSLFGEGSEPELRAALPKAKEYLIMVQERDGLKMKLESQALVSATSPRAGRPARYSASANPDGTPFSKAQIESMKRRRAAKDSTLSHPQAASYIQLLWRGKSARKMMRRRHRSATVISAAWRGLLCRKMTRAERRRWHGVLKDEKRRTTRIQRIAAQRAELALLRRTPASMLADVDKRRRVIAIRVIQRFFRFLFRRRWYILKHGKKNRPSAVVVRGGGAKPAATAELAGQEVADNDDRLTIDVDEEEESAINVSQASFWSRASVSKSTAAEDAEGFDASSGFAPDFRTPMALKNRAGGGGELNVATRRYQGGGEASALRLADLQRRVAAASYENRREKDRKEREAAYAAVGKGSTRGRTRRGYEKLLEVQQVARSKIMERRAVEEIRREDASKRRRRLDRFSRLADLLSNQPSLGKVSANFLARKEGADNNLRDVMAGWKLPRSEKSLARSKRAHKATLNALKAREQWWSLHMGEKFGGGTFDLREVCDFQVEDGAISRRGDERVAGKYDADEASLLWYEYAGGHDENVEKLLHGRTKVREEERMGYLDEEIEGRLKRQEALKINITKCLAREQTKMRAPGKLEGIVGDRKRKLDGAAVCIQRMVRGASARKVVSRQISNFRVAGALQMLVQELGGGGGAKEGAGSLNGAADVLGGVLGSILGGGGGGGGGLGLGLGLGGSAAAARPASGWNGSTSLFQGRGGGKANNSSVPKKGGSGSAPPSPAVYSRINQYLSETPSSNAEGEAGHPSLPSTGGRTPLMKGMLVDVDLGLGAHDKPKAWTPAKIVSVNAGGDVTVEFKKDGGVMNGVRQERVRIRDVTPSTAYLERRGRETTASATATPSTEAKGIFTPNTATLVGETKGGGGGGGSAYSASGEENGEGKMQRHMLDDSAVLGALEGADLATAAMVSSPLRSVEASGAEQVIIVAGTPLSNDSSFLAGGALIGDDDEGGGGGGGGGGSDKENGDENGEENGEESVERSSKFVVPKLNISGVESKEGGYVSPPSSKSPLKSSPSKGSEVVRKIIEHVTKMKEERGGKNTNILGSTFNSAREFVCLNRVRSAIKVVCDGLCAVSGDSSSLLVIFNSLDFASNGFVGVDDVVDVLVCVDASLSLNLASICDPKSVALSLSTWLEKGDGNVNLAEIGSFVRDAARDRNGGDVRAVCLHLGRLMVLAGSKLGVGVGGAGAIDEIWGRGAMSCDVGQFKKGLASLKPKLTADEVHSVIGGITIGEDKRGEDKDGDFVSLSRFADLCFPCRENEMTGRSHRDLQRTLKRHFDTDNRMVKNLMLLCSDVDHDDSGYLDWKMFLRVVESSSLLLTLQQSYVLCLLLTRDGGCKVGYAEITRIARGDYLTMPQALIGSRRAAGGGAGGKGLRGGSPSVGERGAAARSTISRRGGKSDKGKQQQQQQQRASRSMRLLGSGIKKRKEGGEDYAKGKNNTSDGAAGSGGKIRDGLSVTFRD